MTYVLCVAYGLVGLIFLARVLLEGHRNRLPWSPLRIAGIMACAVWPVTLLVVFVMVVSDRQPKPVITNHEATPTARPAATAEQLLGEPDFPQQERKSRRHVLR